MKMTFDAKKLARIAEQHRLKFVVLHGSEARGRARRDSDLDVAIVGDEPIDLGTQIRLAGELGAAFAGAKGRELDLKTLDRVDPLFRYEVVRDGQLLYGDPTAYEEFKAFAARAHDDARPLLALERALSRKFQQHLNAFADRLRQKQRPHAQ